MTMQDIPRVVVGTKAFREQRVRLLVDFNGTGLFDGPNDDVSAAISQSVVCVRGTDNTTQANGVLLSGSLSTALSAPDRGVFNPKNPTSPLFKMNPQGRLIQLQYVHNILNQVVIPLWTGYILDWTAQSGMNPNTQVRAIGVLGYINDQGVTLPSGTFKAGTPTLGAAAQFLKLFGVDVVFQETNPSPQGETMIGAFNIDNKKPLDILRDFMLLEGGTAIEKADGKVLLLGRNWRNFVEKPTVTFTDAANTGEGEFSFSPNLTEVSESSITIFNTFQANIAEKEEEVVEVGEFKTPEIRNLYGTRVLFYDSTHTDLARVTYSSDDSEVARNLLQSGTIHLPAKGNVTVSLNVEPSGGVPRIGAVGYIDFETRTIDGSQTILTAYDGTNSVTGAGGSVAPATLPDLRAYVSRLDETTVSVSFANLTDRDFLCYHYTVESSVIAPSEVQRITLPDDGSNVTSVRKYGVQVYPQVPTFTAQKDNPAIAQARNWASLLYTLHSEPRDIITVATSPPKSGDREALEPLSRIEIGDKVNIKTGTRSGLYIEGEHYLQHMRLEIDNFTDDRGVYYWDYTYEPGLPAVEPSISAVVITDTQLARINYRVELINPNGQSVTVYARRKRVGTTSWINAGPQPTTGTAVRNNFLNLSQNTEYEIQASLTSDFSEPTTVTATTLRTQVTPKRGIRILTPDRLINVTNISLGQVDVLKEYTDLPALGKGFANGVFLDDNNYRYRLTSDFRPVRGSQYQNLYSPIVFGASERLYALPLGGIQYGIYASSGAKQVDISFENLNIINIAAVADYTSVIWMLDATGNDLYRLSGGTPTLRHTLLDNRLVHPVDMIEFNNSLLILTQDGSFFQVIPANGYMELLGTVPEAANAAGMYLVDN